MGCPKTVALVATAYPGEALPLADALRQQACEVHLAAWRAETRLWCEQHPGKLALSRICLQEGRGFPLVGLVGDLRATLFFFVHVEDGYWWVLALRLGRNSLGEPALRPTDFRKLLPELLSETLLLRAPALQAGPEPALTRSEPKAAAAASTGMSSHGLETSPTAATGKERS